jgi:hypothetical protein
MSWQITALALPFTLCLILAIVWAAALIYIWFDADEVYGTGWFWMLMVLVAPIIAIPAYFLMKLSTHRGWRGYLEAEDRLERKRMLRGGHVSALKLLEKSNADADPEIADDGERAAFEPFRPTFAAPAERLRSIAEHRGPADLTAEHSSSDTQESAGTVHERLSWRRRRLRDAGPEEPPF